MKLIESTFSRFSLTPEEENAGMILSTAQIGLISNMRADIAEQKLNLVFTPNDVLSYTQQEAFLKGQLDLLTHFIDRSVAAQQAVAAQVKSQEQSPGT